MTLFSSKKAAAGACVVGKGFTKKGRGNTEEPVSKENKFWIRTAITGLLVVDDEASNKIVIN